jgi:hypothetical protein
VQHQVSVWIFITKGKSQFHKTEEKFLFRIIMKNKKHQFSKDIENFKNYFCNKRVLLEILLIFVREKYVFRLKSTNIIFLEFFFQFIDEMAVFFKKVKRFCPLFFKVNHS